MLYVFLLPTRLHTGRCGRGPPPTASALLSFLQARWRESPKISPAFVVVGSLLSSLPWPLRLPLPLPPAPSSSSMRSGIREKTLLQLQPLPLGSPLKGLSLISMPLGPRRPAVAKQTVPRSSSPSPSESRPPLARLLSFHLPLGASDCSLFLMCLRHHSRDAFFFFTIENRYFSAIQIDNENSQTVQMPMGSSPAFLTKPFCTSLGQIIPNKHFHRRKNIRQSIVAALSSQLFLKLSLQHSRSRAEQVVVLFQWGGETLPLCVCTL